MKANRREERNVRRLKGEMRLTGCGFYRMLRVRVLVKWSHGPRCSLTLNFSGYVCIWWPLTLAPGTCLRSLLSISDASAGARTSHTYKHTQCDGAKRRISQPYFSWIYTPTLIGFTQTMKMINYAFPTVFIYPLPATDYHSHQHGHVHTHLNTLIK